MAKGHRSQIKKERNAQKDSRPKARVTFVRLSSTKANIVLDQIKGKDVNTALAILAYTPRWGARVIEKVLKSAIANAEHNMGMDVSKLYVDEAFSTKGPTLKRIRPRAQGRAYQIQKQTSHITVVLNER
ncbi:50S ribosomal protein L22 [Sporanaerobium hydrogeniformans]|uniref:50S ribosomal protein L22 n=1 Tax=Sporanaerobium hydrogeniformans TaxID=3072179 RepID=A0AC61DE39_9FIRM|nr:50S ribosomal protein L22 [Sporanaerobium hydrogeniformans]PHV71328.1 50S ribosomal protein L22 [Sporanaerobium hydrogeniformans]